MAVYLDNNGIIHQDKIMSLSGLKKKMMINELWVFQTYVAVSMSTGEIFYFEKPVYAGSSSELLS